MPAVEPVPRVESDNGPGRQAVSTLLLDAVEHARAIAGADGAAVALRDREGMICRASTGDAPDVGSRPAANSGFTAECLRTGRVMVCQDAENDSRITVSLARSMGLGSAAAVPILADRSTLGVLEVFSSQSFAFDSVHIARLEEIATDLAKGLAESHKKTSPEAIAGALTNKSSPARPQLVITSAGATRPALVTSDVLPPVPDFVAEKNPVGENRSSFRPWIVSVVVAAIALVVLFPYLGRDKRFESSSTTPNRSESEPAPAENEQGGKSNNLQPRVPKSLALPDSSKGRAKTSQADSGVDLKQRQAQTSSTSVRTLASAEQPRDDAEPPGPSHINVRNPPALIPDQGIRSRETLELEAKSAAPDLQISSALTEAPDLALRTAMPAPLAASLPDFKSQHTFHGHTSWISGLAFSPDGRQLASSSWDRSVKFWEVPEGKELAVAVKMMEVQALAFSPNGRLLATENSSNAVTLWDPVTGREILTLPSNKPQELPGRSWVYSIAFSPNSSLLATSLDDKTTRVWNVETGHPVFDLITSRKPITYVAFSADGRWLASGKDDKTIAIWDVASRKIVRTLNGHKKTVYAVAFSPNGRWLASAGADKSVKIWELPSGREVHTLAGHESSVTCVAFSPDSRWLASGSWDKTTKIWDVERGQELQTLKNSHPVYAVAFDSRGGWLASGTQDGTIKLWHSSRP